MFVFFSRGFALTPAHYILKLRGDDGEWMCVTGFMNLDLEGYSGLNWVIGDIFLAQFYVEYDLENERVGFANKKPLNV